MAISKLSILKSSWFLYTLLGLSFFGLFVTWQRYRHTSIQLREKTEQLREIFKNPVVKTVEGPTKYIEGKQTIKEVVTIKTVEGETKIIEREIVKEPSIKETAGSVHETNFVDPLRRDDDTKRYMIIGQYTINNDLSLGLGVDVFGLYAGPSVWYNIDNKSFTAGAFLIYRF